MERYIRQFDCNKPDSNLLECDRFDLNVFDSNLFEPYRM